MTTLTSTPSVSEILGRVLDGERLGDEDALTLEVDDPVGVPVCVPVLLLLLELVGADVPLEDALAVCKTV